MDSQRAVRVGVDVGGTFTDLVAVVDGETTALKVPSTPAGPEAGVLDAVAAVVDDAGWAPGDVERFGHGTTVATNAVLERAWADTALVTTEGFRDAVEIGRQDRPGLYDLAGEKPDPVVPRDRRFGVAERLDERGRVLDALDDADLDRVVDAVADTDADAVAVATLFAFEDDAHERAIAGRLRERTDAAVSRSSAVHPEIREYERTLLTCLNAALVPVVGEYVAALETGLSEAGVDAPLRLMGSHGGLIAADAARERPVETLLSGPAAGVRGAVHVAERAGLGGDLLTMDMGGTSCDVSLVEGGDPTVTTEATVGDYPVATPTVDVHTVGAGGGSVAWVDEGGALRVGPRSAGADPGPACYGRGGEHPTTTDAHCVLGRIDPRGFVESADDDAVAAAREAVAEHVAEPLGVGVREAAAGILEVADASTERAVRVVSVERGHDPREFALVAYGGAGPLHAASVAAALEIPRVLIPRAAGTLSALGLLVSDLRYELSASQVRPLAAVDPADLEGAYADLVADGRQHLAGDVAPERRRIERRADLRYRGQSHELTVPVPDDLDPEALETVAARFHERHDRRYGHASPDEPVELVTLRVLARGVVDAPESDPPTATGDPDDAVLGTRAVTFDGDAVETRIYDRVALPVDADLAGPAVVEGPESTVVVPPGASATVTHSGDLLLEVAP
jgi:N-methylhydantoinase A